MIDNILLFPYYAFLKLRKNMYDKGKLKSVVSPVPAICIGGLAAGGTGKTPCTEYILSVLLSSKEWKDKSIAVLSRGYKRKSKGFQQVCSDGNVYMFGDEPMQIKRKFPEVTVAVCRDRAEGCGILANPDSSALSGKGCWRSDFPKADIIVLDDAYQARELKAHKTIVLTDYNRPLFKDSLLPLGTLRDLPERLYDADMVVVTKCPESMDEDQMRTYASSLGYTEYDAQTCMALTPGGKSQFLFFAFIEYLPCEPIDETTDSRYLYAKSVIMLTGIAKDTPLLRKLSDRYSIVKKFSLSDHHNFTSADMRRLDEAAAAYPSSPVVTTEKDKQRLLENKFVNRELFRKTFIAPIRMKIHGEEQSGIFEREIVSVGDPTRS